MIEFNEIVRINYAIGFLPYIYSSKQFNVPNNNFLTLFMSMPKLSNENGIVTEILRIISRARFESFTVGLVFLDFDDYALSYSVE